jgi:eukaryotic-like serine/threonine-protein kinase
VSVRSRPDSGPRVTVGQHSVAGVKARNDDSYGVVVPAGVDLATHGIAMAIADGMSSSEGAKEASEHCIKVFLEDYYCTHASWSVKKSASVVLTALNQWLTSQGQRRHQSDRGMVSTFSGVVLKGGMAHVFHAGDCRISRWRDGGQELLTRDHRVRIGNGREHLARAFGIDHKLDIDYRAEPVQAGDVLVFTTDGVHDFLPTLEMARLLAATGADLNGIAAAIVQRALNLGSLDNLTCQIVRIDHVGTLDEAQQLLSLKTQPFPPELSPGMGFDGFTILRELHTSKRTQVYLARDEASGADVVLKTPSVNFEDDPDYIEMFAREEWVGRLVVSPHVIKVHTTQRERRHLYTVMEYFNGQTLRQWMRDHPQPDLETVRALIEQIAKGVRAFHRKDILHLDLKPENVMIDRHGLVKLIDFGSAKAASLQDTARQTQPAAPAGTLEYTAPEVALGEPPTNRSDIYALGVIAYEMLSGRLPYGNGFATPRDVSRLEYLSMRTLRPDVPAWMDAALQKSVAKRPVQRTEALSALVEDLRRPNLSLGFDRPRPLLERDPVVFWRTAAIGLLLSTLVLLVLLAR